MVILDDRDQLIPLFDLDGNRLPGDEAERIRDAVLASDYDGKAHDAFIHRELEAYRERLKASTN